MTSIKNLEFRPSASIDLPKLEESLQSLPPAVQQNIFIGTHVLDPKVLQITHLSTQTDGPNENLLKFFQTTISTLLGSSLTSNFTASLTPSPFDPQSPTSAPIIEYVQIWFPISRITPSYRLQIESDFARADQIWKSVMVGDVGLSTGWVEEEQEHAELPGKEKAICFFVMRGWESMSAFEKFTQTDEFKAGVPILMAWGAPFKLVSSSFSFLIRFKTWGIVDDG